MTNQKAPPEKHAPEGSVATLGAGIHAATVELKSSRSYGVRLLDGRRTTAALAQGVSPKLIQECLRSRRLVMLADGERGPLIVGALQTSLVPQIHEETGAFEVDATQIQLRADATLVLQVGTTSLRLSRSGIARIEGEQMVIDVGALMRVLATKVELP